MSLADPVIIGAGSYRKIVEGVYRLSTSTADQPVDLILKNTLSPDAISSYLMEMRTNKNSTAVPLPGADNVSRVMLQLKHPSKAFTAVELRAQLDALVAFVTTTGVFDRLLLGER